ncbi:MAG: hypothetical protein IJF17_09270 [Thermoguttaceae bacterium]|nr:hypothetical protein [Thermoguttaceae bacterium]
MGNTKRGRSAQCFVRILKSIRREDICFARHSSEKFPAVSFEETIPNKQATLFTTCHLVYPIRIKKASTP